MCMCGDIYCPSCGPAQGNDRCPVCGLWTVDVDDGGDPEVDTFGFDPVNVETGCHCTTQQLADYDAYEVEAWPALDAWEQAENEQPRVSLYYVN